MDWQKVWVPNSQHGFVLGRIVDLGTDEVTVLPVDKSLREITCHYDRMYHAEDDDSKDVDDNCE